MSANEQRPGKGPRLTVVPMTRDRAGEFITRLHRHHRRPQGYIFSTAVADDTGVIRGVALIGRPLARALQDGYTVEVIRTCTDGTPNANSALYGAAWQIARRAGYRRAITYTQEGESGASMRAAGWRPVAQLAPRRGWDTPTRRRDNEASPNGVARVRWEVSIPYPSWVVNEATF